MICGQKLWCDAQQSQPISDEMRLVRWTLWILLCLWQRPLWSLR